MHKSSFMSIVCAVTAGLGFGSATTRAADNDISTAVSGYGTVAGTITNNKEHAYVSSVTQFKGATNQLDIGGDSRLGLQGVVKFGTQFSVTGQMLAQRRGSDDFNIGTEWLYGQYSAAPGLDFRLGRVVLPVFLLSDSRNVGYATTWLRAPNEVYAQSTFTSLDGAQGIWRHNVGPVALTTQLSYGKTSAKVATGVGIIDAEATNVINLALSAEVGDWTVRLAQTRLTTQTTLPLPPPAPTISYSLRDKFLTAGLQYDNGQAIFMSEWARRTENDIPGFGIPLVTTTSWYAAGGWRFGSFTPMVRYAAVKSGHSLLGGPSKGSEGLILRYDAFHNVALKAQVDRYDAAIQQSFVPAAATTGTKINVFSLGADFVF